MILGTVLGLDFYLHLFTTDCLKYLISTTRRWLLLSQFQPTTWAPSQYPKRRLSVRSRKVSKPRDLYLELSDRSEIWQALRQQCYRCACQISKRYDNLKYQSRGFETLRDLTKRRLFGYWDGALGLVIKQMWGRWNRGTNTHIRTVCTSICT